MCKFSVVYVLLFVLNAVVSIYYMYMVQLDCMHCCYEYNRFEENAWIQICGTGWLQKFRKASVPGASNKLTEGMRMMPELRIHA